MSLPNLPKQHKDPEAKFGLEFRKYWEANPFRGTIELKHSLGKDSIPFSVVKEEQIIFALSAHSKKGVLCRVTLGTVGASDYIGLVEEPIWVVIRFPKEFHIISMNAFALEKKRSTRKSLTAERAQAISTVSVKI